MDSKEGAVREAIELLGLERSQQFEVIELLKKLWAARDHAHLSAYWKLAVTHPEAFKRS